MPCRDVLRHGQRRGDHRLQRQRPSGCPFRRECGFRQRGPGRVPRSARDRESHVVAYRLRRARQAGRQPRLAGIRDQVRHTIERVGERRQVTILPAPAKTLAETTRGLGWLPFVAQQPRQPVEHEDKRVARIAGVSQQRQGRFKVRSGLVRRCHDGAIHQNHRRPRRRTERTVQGEGLVQTGGGLVVVAACDRRQPHQVERPGLARSVPGRPRESTANRGQRGGTVVALRPGQQTRGIERTDTHLRRDHLDARCREQARQPLPTLGDGSPVEPEVGQHDAQP